MPEPLLVGRNPDKLAPVARAPGSSRWTTDLDAALSDPGMTVYFDAQTTRIARQRLAKAIAGGQAHLLREAHGHEHPEALRPVRAGPQEGREERRGAGQAVAARAS